MVIQVQHAFWYSFLTQSIKRRREIFIFEVLTTTFLYMKLPLHENHSYQTSEIVLR